MPILDQQRVYDGASSFIGGQDAGKRANLIGKDQCARLENVVCRGGSLRTRPAFKQLSLNFRNSLLYNPDGSFLATLPQSDQPPPSAVTFNPSSGTYFTSTGTFQVTIATTTLGASIRWTSDGTQPTRTHGNLITGSSRVVTLPGGVFTLKAIAVRYIDSTVSPVATADYTVIQEGVPPPPPPPPPGPPEEESLPSRDTFLQGLFQGVAYYDPSVADDALMVSVGGRLFKVVPRKNSADVTEIVLDKRNRKNIPIAYLIQADRFLLVQDGESSCIIYDGVKARRAGKDEIPVGTIMAYGLGRVVLIGVNKRDILFGDLYGSHTGDPGESILQFTETNFLTEGGAASIPFSMGHIKAATFYPIQDTSMGQGELLVFAEKGMASFALSLPREVWKTSQFQRLGLIEIGGRGHRAFTPVNGDVWFRSGDGWRSYRQARAEAKGWYQLPLSSEVDNYVRTESQTFLAFTSSIRFDNRLIATVTPYPNQGRVYHNGFVPLDFDVLSSFGQALKPAWDGHWSGIKTTQLIEGNFNGVHRAFAFGLDESGNNALYEITEDAVADSSGLITSSFDSRSFTFEQPFNENTVYDNDIWFDSVRAPTSVQAFVKPDQYPQWLPWNPYCAIAPLEPINGLNSLAGIGTTDAGFRPRRSLGKPNLSCDSAGGTNRDFKRSYEMQVRLQWTGNAAVSKFRLHSKPEVERATANK